MEAEKEVGQGKVQYYEGSAGIGRSIVKVMVGPGKVS